MEEHTTVVVFMKRIKVERDSVAPRPAGYADFQCKGVGLSRIDADFYLAIPGVIAFLSDFNRHKLQSAVYVLHRRTTGNEQIHQYVIAIFSIDITGYGRKKPRNV